MINLSKCCNAPVRVGGKGSTHYYICKLCCCPCDIEGKPELVIRVPQFPPNLNKRSRNWYVNHTQEREFADTVRLCAVNARNEWEEAHPYCTTDFGYGKSGKWETLQKATISVTFYVPESRTGPLPDAHNLVSTLKKSIDALTARPRGTGEYAQVGIGLIEDDSPEHLTWGDIKVVREGREEVMELRISGRTE